MSFGIYVSIMNVIIHTPTGYVVDIYLRASTLERHFTRLTASFIVQENTRASKRLDVTNRCDRCPLIQLYLDGLIYDLSHDIR